MNRARPEGATLSAATLALKTLGGADARKPARFYSVEVGTPATDLDQKDDFHENLIAISRGIKGKG